jgi:hypothetical protein
MASSPALSIPVGGETIRYRGRFDQELIDPPKEARHGAFAARPASSASTTSRSASRITEIEGFLPGRLFEFLGFEISEEYPQTIGWTNGKTPVLDRAGRGPQDPEDRRRGSNT